MSASTASSAINTLRNPDGSATHTALGYTIVGSVNGPIEVSRRDELPEEVTLEVTVRPAVGVGSEQPLHTICTRYAYSLLVLHPNR
jgi:exosome complex component RRP46